MNKRKQVRQIDSIWSVTQDEGIPEKESFLTESINDSIDGVNLVLTRINSALAKIPGGLLDNSMKRSLTEATVYIKSGLESLEKAKERLG